MARSAEALNTTRLIHRGDSTAGSWWRTAAVSDLPGAYGPEDLEYLDPLLPAIRSLGFDAILLRTAESDVSSQRHQLARLVEATHDADLKIMVRIVAAPRDQITAPTATPPLLGLSDNRERLIARTRDALDAGVDGVDVGLIADAPELGDNQSRRERFTQTVNQQLAELADLESTTILTAEATRANESFFNRHLTEEWFHHLRDDALYGAPWDGNEIQHRIKQTYADRDQLGHTAAWRPSLATWAENPRMRGLVTGSWEDGAPSARTGAMLAYAVSLPGAVYLSLLTCGGAVVVTPQRVPHVNLDFGASSGDMFNRRLAQSVLQLRRQYSLGSANLAFIDGLSWAEPGVAVHLSGPIMVVLNTSTRTITVPSRHTPVVYSGGFVDTYSEGTRVEPESCAWFVAGRPEPVDPANYR